MGGRLSFSLPFSIVREQKKLGERTRGKEGGELEKGEEGQNARSFARQRTRAVRTRSRA